MTLMGSPTLAQEAVRILVLPVEVEGDELAAFAMTEALEQAARDSGREPTVSGETPDNIAAIAGCAGALEQCVDAIGDALAVDEVLYAEATAEGNGSYRVRVVHLARGRAAAERLVEVVAALPEEIGGRLAPDVGRLLAGEFADGPAQVLPSVKPEAPAPPPTQRSDGFSFDRVGAAPWTAIGAGVALFGVGAVFGIAGEAKQGDIDDAPTDTAEELEALRDLEDDADLLTGTGNALMLAGGLVAAVGIGWAVYQATRREPATGVAVVPVASPDQVGLALRVSAW